MPFIKPGRIELDIGCGSGGFLQLIAAENPQTTFIGIDINEQACAAAHRRCRKTGLTNVLVCHAEALKVLREVVPESRISAFHIYFPSPWLGEIRRHNVLGADISGRLVTPEFIREVVRTATDGAVIRIVTDHHSYFASVVGGLQSQSFVSMPWSSPTKRCKDGMVVATEWEEKILKKYAHREILYYQGVI